jgi:hypothetical protein
VPSCVNDLPEQDDPESEAGDRPCELKPSYAGDPTTAISILLLIIMNLGA